jgi:1,4-alpha-glucan branching enzyme
MLYLDYSRKDGEWIPNRYGGRENLEALEFVRELNKAAYEAFPGIQMIAEESSAWPMVSRPVYLGGLGFGLKWDMGWMHDTLRYFALDPIHRRYHHNDITFRSLYAFHENFVLSLSHDECVHGKGAMIAKMAGDDLQKFANLRCLYTYMYSQPGKKLLFMGDEIAQWSEWNHDSSIDWDLLEYDRHRQIQKLVTDLNRLYRNERALHLDCDPLGFEWIDGSDQENSVLSYLRHASQGDEIILCVFNFTPVPRKGYRVGVPHGGSWEEIFNCDASTYGGGGKVYIGTAEAQAMPVHNRPFALTLDLPPLAGIFLKWKQNR